MSVIRKNVIPVTPTVPLTADTTLFKADSTLITADETQT